MLSDEAQIRQLQRHCIQAFELWYGAALDLGTQIDHIADATAFRWTVLPIPLFNRAIGLGDEREPSDDEIDRLVDLYRKNGVGGHIQLSPLADLDAIGRMLGERGLSRNGAMATLALARNEWRQAGVKPRDPALTIETVEDGAAGDFVAVLLEGFGLDPEYEPFLRAAMELAEVQNFLARYDGEPTGVGQIFSAAGVGGLYSGAVLERFRGRGIQSALISHRIQVAFDQGLDLLYSGTEEVDNQSSRNLRRQDFSLAFELQNWEIPAEDKPSIQT